MGTMSTLYSDDSLIIRAAVPEFTSDELLEREAFIAEARARGLTVTDERTPRIYEKVKSFLDERKDYLGYWFTVEKPNDPSGEILEVSLNEVSGKAYDLDSEFLEFVNFLLKEGCSLEGKFYRHGESIGDLERFVIENGEITTAKAALVFPDGEKYLA